MMRKLTKLLLVVALLSLSGTAWADLEEGDLAVARNKVALRERPGSDYRVVARIEGGDSVQVERVKGEWVKVKAGARAGWAPGNLFDTGRSAKARKSEDGTVRKRKHAFVQDGQFVRRAEDDAARAARLKKARAQDRVSDDDDTAAPAAASDDDQVSDDDAAPKPQKKMAKAKAAKWKTTKAKVAPKPAADDEDDAASDDDAPPARAEKARAEKVAKSDDGDARDDDSDADDAKPEKVEKPKKEKNAPGTKVAAVGKTTLRNGPSSTASTALVAHDGDEMKVIKRAKGGRWLLVEADDGSRGWVESARIKPLTSDDDDDDSVRGPQGSGIALNASTGFVSMSQDFQSDATAFLGKYRISSAAGAVDVGGLYSYIKGSWEFGVDGSYRLAVATPGIEVTTMAGAREDLSVMEHTVDLGGRAGWRSGDGMMTGLYARLGWHMDATQIDQSRLAPLPSETLTGLTVGAGLDMPKMSEHFGMRAHVDYLFSGTRDQTIGLRDGKDIGTAGLLLGASLGYHFGESWAAEGGYNLSYMATTFQGPSERLMGQGTWATRANLDHILLIGLSYAAR